MKKIRILTYWGVPNYGAWTQAYALNRIIDTLIDREDDVKHIDYLEQSHWDMYYRVDERLYNSFMYSWNIIAHTKKYTAQDIEKETFDILITGADSIWTLLNIPINADYHLIGNKVKARNLSAYASSIGGDTVDELAGLPEVREGISKYSHIAVRDRNTAELVKKINGKNVPIVLDPALLWDFRNDVNVRMPKYENYICVYGIQWDKRFIERTVEFARKKNMRLISVGFVNDWCDISLKMIELRGIEWIGMFSEAAYVITSTFHGLMLALNYRKQFKFCQVGFVKNRSQTLVEALNIPDFSANYEQNIDYEIVMPELNRLRRDSIVALKEILEL